MIQGIIGQKIDQGQAFLTNGTRIPVTTLLVEGNIVVAVKTSDNDGYRALQLGFGQKKHPTKPQTGHAKKAHLNNAPLFLKEVAIVLEEGELPKAGEAIKAADILKPGDIIDVVGISKGKGFAGGVKRHHFKGGPRTHGQSDRERAPGSIGQTTTPGRVYKGKRMAGRMGHARVTVKNLRVVDVTERFILVQGLVPGPKNTVLIVKKTGEDKKFIPLYREEEKVREVQHAA